MPQQQGCEWMSVPEAAQRRSACLVCKALGPTHHTVKQQKRALTCLSGPVTVLSGFMYFRKLLNPMVSFPVNDKSSFSIGSWLGQGRGGCPPVLVPRESRYLILSACEGLGSLECVPEAGPPGCYFAPHWQRVTECHVSDLGLAVSIIILSFLDILWPSLCLKEAGFLVS